MDKTVPVGAAILLDFIGDTEAPQGYNTIYGNNQRKLSRPVTNMTLAEIQAAQGGWTKSYGSSATGRYQFMKKTLGELIAELRLSMSQKLDANLQDRLGYHLLKRRGYAEFMDGQISRAAFGKRLAQEWASFPVLVAAQGQKRKVERGQSYYAGDGLNKALVKPETVEAVLDKVKDAGNGVAIGPVGNTGPSTVPGVPIPANDNAPGFWARLWAAFRGASNG